jgi:hypothetical protein
MAITPRFFTGFNRGGMTLVERYANSIVTNGIYPKIETGVGRLGTDCLRMNYNSSILWTFPEDDEFLVAIALKHVSAFPTGNETVMTFMRAGNPQVRVEWAPDGRFVFKHPTTAATHGTTSGATSVGLFSQLLIYCKVSDTVGELRAYWNGSATPDATLNLTGLDTKGYAGGGAGDAFIDGFKLGGSSDSGIFDVDDLHLCNGGSDLIGDRHVIAEPPTGDGSHNDATPTTGTDRFAMVNDATPDLDDSSTIAAVTGKQTFTYPDMAFTPTPGAWVDQKWMTKKDDAGTRTLKDLVKAKVGGVEYAGTAIELTTDYRSTSLIRTEINGSPLTKTNIDANEWGGEFA